MLISKLRDVLGSGSQGLTGKHRKVTLCRRVNATRLGDNWFEDLDNGGISMMGLNPPTRTTLICSAHPEARRHLVTDTPLQNRCTAETAKASGGSIRLRKLYGHAVLEGFRAKR